MKLYKFDYYFDIQFIIYSSSIPYAYIIIEFYYFPIRDDTKKCYILYIDTYKYCSVSTNTMFPAIIVITSKLHSNIMREHKRVICANIRGQSLLILEGSLC